MSLLLEGATTGGLIRLVLGTTSGGKTLLACLIGLVGELPALGPKLSGSTTPQSFNWFLEELTIGSVVILKS